MNLKLISSGIIWLASGMYFIVLGIKLYRKNVVISYSSAREKSCLLWSLFWLIDMTFITKDKVDLLGLLIGLIPIILLIFYIVYSRINSVKYEFCNVNKEIYEEVILNTLIQENIEFTSRKGFIELKDPSVYIEFINGGILLKRIKQLPSYQHLLIKLEDNIKNIKHTKTKRGWIYSTFLGGIFIVIIAIVAIVLL